MVFFEREGKGSEMKSFYPSFLICFSLVSACLSCAHTEKSAEAVPPTPSERICTYQVETGLITDEDTYAKCVYYDSSIESIVRSIGPMCEPLLMVRNVVYECMITSGFEVNDYEDYTIIQAMCYDMAREELPPEVTEQASICSKVLAQIIQEAIKEEQRRQSQIEI